MKQGHPIKFQLLTKLYLVFLLQIEGKSQINPIPIKT